MTITAFLLVSPAPVDGYPPVQYQARLLADAGYAVELVTVPLIQGRNEANFSHPGVRITCLPWSLLRPGRTAWRVAALVAAVCRARYRLGRRNTAEISYEPIGIWISDLAPGKPARRVAHFHEMLQHGDLHIERRLPRVITEFDLVVVADEARAALTRDDLGLAVTPMVLANYPLQATQFPPFNERCRNGEFEVIYCGRLGLDQKLDVVIRSVADWPEGTKLTLIGQDDTAAARHLRDMVVKLGVTERVHFAGWLDLPDAETRIAKANLGFALLDSSTAQWRTALGASNKRYQLMKAGLPQIGDFNPGVPELIEGNGVGACVHAHEPDEITLLVRAYAADETRCRVEGERAFALHQAEFNYERAFERLLEQVGTW